MILLDINVLLDVLQRREPHFRASGLVIERVLQGHIPGALPAHAVTTLHYLLGKYQNSKKADEVIAWLLKYFVIAPVDQKHLNEALQLRWPDFEDAVVATCAHSLNCKAIITRNVKDFNQSTVPALTPTEYLLLDE